MGELIDRVRFSVDPVSGLDSLCMSGGRINAASALGARPTIDGLSTRCLVLTGDAIAITGINITGPNAKRVVFRAQGPNLANYGVQGVLANPTIAIYNGAGQWIGSNDDWQSLSASEQTELAAAGLTPASPLESAWMATLNPGIYTVHLSGVGGGTGVGMIEGYALDGSTVNRLYAISTRCYVGTGDQVAIAGAFVSGNKPRQVLIRAQGPSLNVSNPLSDTVITLYDG